ncbi:hypothetical protein B5F40_03305 [Gordonibacter sp. An230]|uniref:hypothetical protein n=1 Tax=Gordonibacter sp. An230 TaxID=1965592 RepID=UPI000B3A9520|nr:hypothetical protein [Gordonibacter sp. An230]OUO91477.1 hypothetical protein B5F40_03305 [Gordonibacter sp. An230]
MVANKRVLAALMTAALVSFGGLTLAGCSQSNSEEIVREGVTEELESLKRLDDSLLDQLSTNAEMIQLTMYGVDPKDFASTYLDGFDYRIDSVTVEGNKATAVVVLTCKSTSVFAETLEAAYEEMANDDSLMDLSPYERNDRIGQVMMETLESIPVAETAPINLEFQLDGNMWTITPESEKSLSTALFSE